MGRAGQGRAGGLGGMRSHREWLVGWMVGWLVGLWEDRVEGRGVEDELE